MNVAPALNRWLVPRLGSSGPSDLEPLSGGHSNETHLLTAPDGQWILRRPPSTAIATSANDLGREHAS